MLQRPYVFSLSATVLVGALFVSASMASDPGTRCETGKLKATARYMACRLKVDAKGVLAGSPGDYAKCESGFAGQWGKAEAKAEPGECPSEGDQASIDARVTADTAEVATVLSGGSVASCGIRRFPATGAMTIYGEGSDGDVRAGAALLYVDNGDGTITDLQTGLMWEKKKLSGAGVHGVYNDYTWSTGAESFDGTLKTEFLAELNDVSGGGEDCFADYCDWRIPNVKELGSIVDFERRFAAVDPVFDTEGCGEAPCGAVTDPGCSCTLSTRYWSSTTLASASNDSTFAWSVHFRDGEVLAAEKTEGLQARAVRGGL